MEGLTLQELKKRYEKLNKKKGYRGWYESQVKANPNAGNVPLNNAIFNMAMGSAKSVDMAQVNADNFIGDAPATADGGVGMVGMTEGKNWKEKVIATKKGSGKIVKMQNMSPTQNDQDYYILIDDKGEFVDKSLDFNVLRDKLFLNEDFNGDEHALIERISNLKDGEVLRLENTHNDVSLEEPLVMCIKKNPKFPGKYILWNEGKKSGEKLNVINFSSLNNAVYWASQYDMISDKYDESINKRKGTKKMRIQEAGYPDGLQKAYNFLKNHSHYYDHNIEGDEYFSHVINAKTLKLDEYGEHVFNNIINSDNAVEQIDNIIYQVLDYYIPPKIDYFLKDDEIIIVLPDPEYNYNLLDGRANLEEVIHDFALQQVGYNALDDEEVMRNVRDQLADILIDTQDKVKDFDDAMKMFDRAFLKYIRGSRVIKNPNKKINEDYDDINKLYNYLHLHKHYVEKGRDYFSADVKVWDLGLTDEQENEFFEMLKFEDGGMEDFLDTYANKLENIEMVGRNGGHLILKDESLDPSDYRLKYADVEYRDWLDYHYFPGDEPDDARADWEAKVREDYEKVTEFDSTVDDLINLLKRTIDKRIENKNNIDEDFTKTMFEDVDGDEPELDGPEFDEINYYDPDEWDKYDYLDSYEEDVEEDEDCGCERELNDYYKTLKEAQDELPRMRVRKPKDLDTPECKLNRCALFTKYNDDVDDLEEKYDLNERKGMGGVAEEIADISDGDYEAHLDYLNKQLKALKDEKYFLETQAPREIGRGGNFDNLGEIDKALNEVNKDIETTQLKIDLITKVLEEN